MTTRQPTRSAAAGWPVPERSIVGSVLGLPGYAAIGIALGFTALGVFIDLNRINGLGSIFKGCYFAGCLLAVCWVKRRALFGPMVQPPLLLAVAVPSVVLASGGGAGSGGAGLTDHLLTIGAPLLNSFPTMAVTTAFAVAVGLARYALQRPSGAEPAVRRRPVDPSRGGRRPPAADRRPGERMRRPPSERPPPLRAGDPPRAGDLPRGARGRAEPFGGVPGRLEPPQPPAGNRLPPDRRAGGRPSSRGGRP